MDAAEARQKARKMNDEALGMRVELLLRACQSIDHSGDR
jgi:hypothetical protein